MNEKIDFLKKLTTEINMINKQSNKNKYQIEIDHFIEKYLKKKEITSLKENTQLNQKTMNSNELKFVVKKDNNINSIIIDKSKSLNEESNRTKQDNINAYQNKNLFNVSRVEKNNEFKSFVPKIIIQNGENNKQGFLLNTKGKKDTLVNYQKQKILFIL